VFTVSNLALLDCFFFFYIQTGKKGLVNVLNYSCSRDSQFLEVVDWLLIATKSCILVGMT